MSAPTDSLVSLAAFVDGLSAFVGYMPPSPPAGPIAFLASDATTQGSWLGIYGGDGYVLPGIGGSLPSYATVPPSPKSDYVWSASTSDMRAVQSPDGATRKAACWFSPTSFDVAVDVGPTPRRVAIYCLDWDATNRSQRVDVLDASGTILDTRNVSGFHGGIWLAWTVTGAVTFRFTRLAGANAVLSAVCFGGSNQPPLPPPPPPPPPPVVIAPPVAPGGYPITVIASGMNAAQQASFAKAAVKLMSIITAALPEETANGTPTKGIIINASAMPVDGPGGILGSGGPDSFRAGTFLPKHATMVFDSADSGTAFDIVVLHEMCHCLGFGTLWAAKGLLTGAGTPSPLFAGVNATREFNAIFGRNSTGVPVQGGNVMGTSGVHWDEGTFGGELMTGYLTGRCALSRVSVGQFADLGYTVNYEAADAYSATDNLIAGQSMGIPARCDCHPVGGAR